MSDTSDRKLSFEETPFSEWASKNVYEDPVEEASRYIEDLRGEYLNAGLLTEEVETDLRNNLSRSLASRGLLTEENLKEVSLKIDSYSRPSLLEDATFVKDNVSEAMEFTPEEEEKLATFITAGGVENVENPEDLIEIQEIVRSKKEKHLVDLYDRGELIAGSYYDKEGNRQFLGGKVPEGKTELDVIRENADFGVLPTDFAALKILRREDPLRGNLMQYEIKKRLEAEEQVKVFLDSKDTLQDTTIIAQFEALARDLGSSSSWEWDDKAYDATGDWLGDIGMGIKKAWNFVSFDKEEFNEVESKIAYEEMREDFQERVAETKQNLVGTLTKRTNLDPEIVEDVVEDITTRLAFNGSPDLGIDPVFKFTDKTEDLGNNVIRTNYSGVLVQSDLNFKPQLFNRALKQAGLSDEEIRIQEQIRQLNNASTWEQTDEFLSNNEEYAEKWTEAVIDGKRRGLSNNQITEKFVADEDPDVKFSGLVISAKHSFTTLLYGVGAVFGTEWGQQGLLANAEEQANNRQLANVFGIEMGVFQDLGEQVTPLLTDALVTGVGALAAPYTAGGSAVGVGLYFSAKTSATVAARAAVKSMFSSTLKQVSRKTVGKKVETESLRAAAKRIAATELGSDLSGRQILQAYKLYNNTAVKSLGIKSAIFVPAATRSGAYTYGSIYSTVESDLKKKYLNEDGQWAEGWSEERVRQEAHSLAFRGGLTAGVVTGAITTAMGSIGGGKFGGLENAYLKGVSMQQMKNLTNKIAGVSSDAAFKKLFSKSIRKVFVEKGLAGAGNIIRGAAGEGFEEGLDEFVNGIIEDSWTNKSRSFRSRVEAAAHGALLGALLGGASPALGALSRNVGPEKLRSLFTNKEALLELEEKVTADFKGRLSPEQLTRFEKLQEVAPLTAEEEAKQRKKFVEQDQAREEDSEDTPAEEQSRMDSRIDSEAPVESEEISEEEAEREAEQLNFNFAQRVQEGQVDRETETVEQTNRKRRKIDPEVARSEPTSAVLDGEESAVDAQVAVSNPSVAINTTLTAKQKYDRVLAEIEAKEKLYQEAKKELKERGVEGTKADKILKKQAEKDLLKAETSGAIYNPERVSFLRKEAKRVYQKEKREESRPSAIPIKETDIKSIEDLVDSGYPVSFISEHLEQLGIALESDDPNYLRAVAAELRKRIRDKYPVIKRKLPDGGAKLPNTLARSGTVMLDADGDGIFNNDPEGMLTLLQNNIAIPVTREQFESPTRNPAFEFKEEEDGSLFVVDVMVPVKGGLISARTAFDRVGVFKSDYSFFKQLTRQLKNLIENVKLPDENKKFSDPFAENPNAKISLQDLLAKVKDLNRMKSIMAGRGLNHDFLVSAAAALSLRLQADIYAFAEQLQNPETKVSAPLPSIATNINDVAAFFNKQKDERVSKTRRDFASLMDPNTKVHERPDFSAEEAVDNSDTYTPPAADPLPAMSESALLSFLNSKFDDAEVILDEDSDLSDELKMMLNEQMFGGKQTTNDYSSLKLFETLMTFLASGQGASNEPAFELQKRLKLSSDQPNSFPLGAELFNLITILGVASPSITENISKNSELQSYVRGQLEIALDKNDSTKEITTQHVKTFYKQIREASAPLLQRSLGTAKKIKTTRRKNETALEELGLVDGDPESVIAALEEIAKKGPRQLRPIAKALLKDKEFIRSVEFSIDNSVAPHAGVFFKTKSGRRVVSINLNRGNDRGLSDVLIHEYIHAFTAELIATPESFRTDAQNKAVRSLEKLRKIANKKAHEKGVALYIYGTKDIDEFLAHILTSPKFQQFVKRIQPTDKSKQNALVTAFKNIAVLVGMRKAEFIQDALELTMRAGVPEPDTKAGFMARVSDHMVRNQIDLETLAQDMGLSQQDAEAAALEAEASVYTKWAKQYVSAEVNVVIDTNSRVVAKIEDSTGSLIFNPIRAALKLRSMVSNQEIDPKKRTHILGLVLNEEQGHFAANKVVTDEQLTDVINKMSEADFETEIEEYYPLDQQEAALDRLRSSNPKVAAAEKYRMANESMVRFAQLAMRGATTNQQIAFLSTNPDLVSTFINYLKAFLHKIAYHRNVDDVSPEMKEAVNNIVRELRALESGYRPSPSAVHYNGRNGDDIITALVQQGLDTNRMVGNGAVEKETFVEFPDDPESGFFKGYAHGSENSNLTSVEQSDNNRNYGLGVGVYFTKSTQAKGGAVKGAKYDVPTDSTTSREATPKNVYRADIQLQNPLVVDSLSEGNKNRELNKMFLEGIADRYGLTPQEFIEFKQAMDGPDGSFADQNFIKLPNELVVALGRLDEDASYFGKITQLLEIVKKYDKSTQGEKVTGAAPTDAMLRLFTDITGHDGVYSRKEQVLAVWDKNAVALKSRTFRGNAPASITTETFEDADSAEDVELDLESQFGADSSIPEDLPQSSLLDQDRSLGNWLELLDVPLSDFAKADEKGFFRKIRPLIFRNQSIDYDIPIGNSLPKKIYKAGIKIFRRRADKRLVQFYDTNKAFVRETKNDLNKFQARHDSILKRENKRLSEELGVPTTIPPELISEASGSTMGTQLTEAQQDIVQGEYLNAVNEAKNLPRIEKDRAINIAEINKNKRVEQFRESNREQQIRRRDEALTALLRRSPEMYSLVVEMRDLQDRLSKKAMEVFGPTMDPSDLRLAFDFNGGIYMTRRYRMFEDNNFASKVMEDPEYADVRDRSVEFFARKIAFSKLEEVKKNEGGKPLSTEEARQKIEEQLTNKDSAHHSEGRKMMSDFVHGYRRGQVRAQLSMRQGAGNQAIVVSPAAYKNSPVLKQIMEHINDKQNIPKPLRELLGEYGTEAGIENIKMSIAHTASALSNQAFFNKMIDLGTRGDNPWLVSEEEYNRNPDKYDGWVQVAANEKGKDSEGGDGSFQPLEGMYAPLEVNRNLVDLFTNSGDNPEARHEAQNERTLFVRALGEMGQVGVGLSLAYKTLGGVGFYFRNMFGNGGYIGPMQGYYGGLKLLGKELLGMGEAAVTFSTEGEKASQSRMVEAAKGNLADLDFELTALKSMNVFGDELETRVIQDLLTEKVSIRDLNAKLEEAGTVAEQLLKLIEKGQDKAKASDQILLQLAGLGIEKSLLAGATVKETHDILLGFGGRLASAADGFFKIGLYNFELGFLEEAARDEIRRGIRNGKYSSRLVKEGNRLVPSSSMKQEAAEIVKDTAQSYSRALPVIKELQSGQTIFKGLGTVAGPYIRFAADVPRMFLGGLARIQQERSSDNPVIRRRGAKRARGYLYTNAFAYGVSKGSSMLLFGLDDEDEDTALRAMQPSWMKKSSFGIFKIANQYFTIDFTYLNPFAIIQDPFIRASETLLRGGSVLDIFGDLVIGREGDSRDFTGLAAPYASEQILFQAFVRFVFNKDRYGNKVSFESSGVAGLGKRFSNLFRDAFRPRLVGAMYDSAKAFFGEEKSGRPFESPVGHLVKEALPIKPYPIDIDKGFQNYMVGHMLRYNENNRKFKTEITQKKILSAAQVRRIYDQFAKERISLNNELKQNLRGFEKLGLSKDRIKQIASSRNVSAQRLQDLRLGFMNRPIPTVPTEDALDALGKNGKIRKQILKEKYESDYPDLKIKIER